MADSKTADVSAGTSTPTQPYNLVVIQPFGDYNRGDAITADADIAAVLAGENANHVNRVAKPAA